MMDLISIALYSLIFIVLLVATQDIHIFPGAFFSKAMYPWQRGKKVPPRVESHFIESTDGTRLEVWRYIPESKADLSGYRAIIFHGNGGPVESFIFIQMWLADLGIASYNFDYRGFGRSGGWPTERGIYRDSDAVWRWVLEREGINPSKLIVIGISVGSGPAARMAALHQPKLLLLSSAFTDLRSTVRSQALVGFLWPFVWSKFPTIDYVKQLKTTHLLIAHGLRDNIVPSSHSIKLEEAYGGSGSVLRFTSEITGHNMAFYDLKDRLKSALIDLL